MTLVSLVKISAVVRKLALGILLWWRRLLKIIVSTHMLLSRKNQIPTKWHMALDCSTFHAYKV